MACATEDDFAAAVTAAAGADVSILALGTSLSEEVEGHDRFSLSLPGRQLDLLKAVRSVSKRVVLVGCALLRPAHAQVLLHGGSFTFSEAVELSDAVSFTFWKLLRHLRYWTCGNRDKWVALLLLTSCSGGWIFVGACR
jgi:hypothetical protein